MKERSSVSLPALRSFEAVARLRSMSLAAEELGVTQSAVSRSIQLIEDHLGTGVLRRTRPLLSLTEAGELLYTDARLGFERLDAGIRRVREMKQTGRLHIDVLPSFAMRFLIPRLSRLQQQLPEIELDMTVSENAVVFGKDGVDVAIRYGLPEQWPRMASLHLMEEELVLVCAPSILEEYGTGFTPAMLERRRLLRHTTRIEAWREWFDAAGIDPVVPAGLGLEHFIMVIEAAIAGLGFALLPRFMIQRELVTGALVIASMPVLRRPQGYYALHADDAGDDPRIAAFGRWLRDEIHSADIESNSAAIAQGVTA